MASGMVLGLCTYGSPAFAQSATMAVSAVVVDECAISASALAFGGYSTVSGSHGDGQGTVTLRCTKGADPYVALDLGENPLVTQRRLADAGMTLNYQIYKDAGRTNVWGSIGTDRLDPPPAPSNLPRTFEAYGRITGGQSVPASIYADAIVVMVEF